MPVLWISEPWWHLPLQDRLLQAVLPAFDPPRRVGGMPKRRTSPGEHAQENIQTLDRGLIANAPAAFRGTLMDGKE